MSTLRRSTWSVGTIFFVNGFVFSNWIPRINEVRDHLGVSNSGLGLSLLGGGLGGFVGSLLVARVVEHVRTRTVVLVASLVMAVLVPLVAFVPNAAVLMLGAAALCFVGLRGIADFRDGSICSISLRSSVTFSPFAWSNVTLPAAALTTPVKARPSRVTTDIAP